MLSFFEWIIDAVNKFLCENFGGFTSPAHWDEPHDVATINSINWESINCWIVLAVVLLILFGTIFSKSKIIDKLSRNLSWLSVLVWVLGVVLYIIALYNDGVNGISVVLIAAISSFKMFVVSHDISRVPAFLQRDALYMLLFAVAHFAAAFITFLFIFRMLGYKIKSTIKIFFYRWSFGWFCRWYYKLEKKGTVHLFWGVNEASCLMAESIRERENTQEKENTQGKTIKDTIIFIDVDEDSEDYAHRKTDMNYISNTITIKKSEMARLDSINAFVDHCYNGPAAHGGDNDIFGILGLRNIGAILKRSKKIHIYFLSDDEDKNIAGALNLEKDKTLYPMRKDCVIYVHARRSANNEVLDHYAQYDYMSDKIEIKIIDSAYLSIAALKKPYNNKDQNKDNNDDALPVKCVEVNTQTGVVDTPFTSMVIGFGGTGQEAFRFLYEFSAFVNSNKEKTPFKCYAIDENMDKIEGFIREKMPAIGEDELELIKTSVDSKEFWLTIKKIINQLNYLVITINDDAIGFSLAVNLFKYALMHRDNNSQALKIMVRCYETCNEKKMTEVCKNLNKSIEGRNVEIRIFGKMKDIYCYETIISDAIMNEAKEFNRVYENSELSAEKQWDQNFGKTEISRLMTDKKMSRYHAIYDINRRIAQNLSNSCHSRTKMILMGLDEEKISERLNHYYKIVKDHDPDSIEYDCNDEDAQLLRNIAMVEHERWVASHKLLGYTYAPKSDCVKKHHEHLIPWGEITPYIQSFDCRVVDTTIKVAYKKCGGKIS